MAVLNIRAHRMAALAVASLLSSTAIASAATKVVILERNTAAPQPDSCDKSTSVVASCPAAGTSCAQAVAVFASAPDTLHLINVVSTGTGPVVYTLGNQTQN
jgi:hypothetical protein